MMKCVGLIVCLAVFVVNAEPPTYRLNRFRSSSQEATPGSDVEPLTPLARSAPYPPSGWKPAGQRLELPPRAKATPASEYLPAAEYGPPTTPSSEETTSNDEMTSTDETSTTDETIGSDATTTPPPSTEGSGAESGANLVETVPATQPLNEQGAYYVLLPDARLQRILYSVTSDPEKQQFSSRLQSAGTQALTGPLVLYSPQYVQIL